MAEKDPKKVDERAETQASTVQLTPEMTLLLSTLTNTYQTIQRSMAGAQPLVTEQTPPKPFTDKAKIAVEKFNDILAGLNLKPPLTPALETLVRSNNKVLLTWRMPENVDSLSGFKIQRAELPNVPFQDIPLTMPLPREKISYEDELPIKVGTTTYSYRVVALTPNRGEFASNVQEIQITRA